MSNKHRRRSTIGGGTEIEDTCLALDPTESQNLFLNKLRIDVDSLSHQYAHLKASNDKWNQIIMMVSTAGALVTSVLTIAGKTGWPYEVVPIVIQTFSGALAGWMRFYDFPKRMEQIINVKHSYQEIREKFQRSPMIDKPLWDEFTRAVKSLDDVLSPDERDRAHGQALKYMRKERQREAQLTALLAMSHDQVMKGTSFKNVDINADTSSEGSLDSPRRGFLSKLSGSVSRGRGKAQQVIVEMPDTLRTDGQIVSEAAAQLRSSYAQLDGSPSAEGVGEPPSLGGGSTALKPGDKPKPPVGASKADSDP